MVAVEHDRTGLRNGYVVVNRMGEAMVVASKSEMDGANSLRLMRDAQLMVRTCSRTARQTLLLT